MKIRTDFVTNSSSSSFVTITVKSKADTDITFEGEDLAFDIGQFEGDLSISTINELIAAIWEGFEEEDVSELDAFLNSIQKIHELTDIVSLEINEADTFWEGDIDDPDGIYETYGTVEYDEDMECYTGINTWIYSFDEGHIAWVNNKSTTGSRNIEYPWMKGEIFVHTGLDASEEERFDNLVVANGGIVKSSVVLDTNYLVYDPRYGNDTKKMKRAKELIEKGKEIIILTYDEWKNIIEKQ